MDSECKKANIFAKREGSNWLEFVKPSPPPELDKRGGFSGWEINGHFPAVPPKLQKYGLYASPCTTTTSRSTSRWTKINYCWHTKWYIWTNTQDIKRSSSLPDWTWSHRRTGTDSILQLNRRTQKFRTHSYTYYSTARTHEGLRFDRVMNESRPSHSMTCYTLALEPTMNWTWFVAENLYLKTPRAFYGKEGSNRCMSYEACFHVT